MNPQFPYYLLLFVLTIVLRLIRAYRNRPKDLETGKTYWREYLYFGFELVNVSAGVFILLSERATDLVAAIMIMYVILIVVSFFLEEENIGENLKTIGNIFVAVVIVGVTFYAFLYFDGLKQLKSSNKTNSSTNEVMGSWRVALPYVDMSLNRNFAAKSEPIRSLYVSNIRAKNRFDAIEKAKLEFFTEKGPTPFVVKTEKNRLNMIIIDSDTVVEQLKNENSEDIQ